MTADMTLTGIADELYAVTPAEFVSARNARAQAADPALAKSIRALPKPSVAAWVVNLFARERADRLAQALQLAAELREAQDDLDAQTLARLGRERRALTAQLAQEAVALASTRGARVTGSTTDAVQRTLTSAFFDPDAGAAVASGRLVREIEPSSGSPIDLRVLVAGDVPEQTRPVSLPEDEVRAHRERKAAERALHDAEHELERAALERSRVEKARTEASARVDRLTTRVDELAAELARVRDDAETAREAVEDLVGRQAEAAERVAAAEHALGEARAALERG